MLKETLSRYLTSYVTSLDLHHLAVTLCLSDQQASHYGSIIRTVMSRTIEVIYNYFSVDLRCSAGIPVDDPFRISESFLSARQLLASQSTEERILIAERQQSYCQTFTLEPFKGGSGHSRSWTAKNSPTSSRTSHSSLKRRASASCTPSRWPATSSTSHSPCCPMDKPSSARHFQRRRGATDRSTPRCPPNSAPPICVVSAQALRSNCRAAPKTIEQRS